MYSKQSKRYCRITKTSKSRHLNRRLGLEQLEPRFQCAAPVAFSTDVNDDGATTSNDVLRIINFINENKSGSTPPGSRLDVNRDRFIAPMDVLTVINLINSGHEPINPDLVLSAPSATNSVPIKATWSANDERIETAMASTLSPEGVFTELDVTSQRDITIDAPTDGEYDFQLSVQLKPESYWATIKQSVTLDQSDPVITETSVADNSRVSSPSVFVRYTVSDNGNAEDIDQAFDLIRGPNELHLIARDVAGNVGEKIVHVERIDLPHQLTPEHAELRDEIMSKSVDWFETVSVDTVTGFPVDHTTKSGDSRANYTQLTLIGMKAQELAGIITKRVPSQAHSPEDAIQKLGNLINDVRSAQSAIGYEGLLPAFLELEPVLKGNNDVTFVDNGNLTQAFAVSVGWLEAAGFDKTTVGEQLVGSLQQFLDNQREGYLALYSPTMGQFHQSVDSASGTLSSSYIDRLFSEWRSGVAFVTAYFDTPRDAWDNLPGTMGIYETQQGRLLDVPKPWDGGAFQITFPTLWMPEMDFPAMRALTWNHIIAQLDFADRNGDPGIHSASSLPQVTYVYRGKIGAQNLAETNETLIEDVASIYALAPVFVMNPTVVMERIGAYLAQVPALSGPFGPLDSANAAGQVSPYYVGIDIGAVLLGLEGSGAEGMKSFLSNRGQYQEIVELYSSIPQIVVAPPVWPQPELSEQEQLDLTFPTAIHLLRDGSFNPIEFRGQSPQVTRNPDQSISYVGGGYAGGHFSPTVDPSLFQTMLMKIRSRSTSAFNILLRLEANYQRIVGTTVTLRGPEWQWIKVTLPQGRVPVDILMFDSIPGGADFDVGEVLFLPSP